MEANNFLGTYWGDNDRPAFLPLDDRRRHILITGASGTGKSTLLANLFMQEAEAGRGALLIDPHGSLATQSLDLVPRHRIKKTIYFNPSDTAHPIGFNPLYKVPREQRPARASAIVSAIQSIWGDISWGPKLQHVLYNTIAALLDVGDATLLGISRMLQDAQFRERIKRHILDPQVRNFWNVTFNTYLADGPQTFMSVINKVEQITASPVIRNILGQPKSSFDPQHLMDNGYLFIANLSQGALGDEHANLLGSLLISAFQFAAMSRESIPHQDRKDFAIIVDEFGNFTTDKFKSLLSEVRKYKVSLILAHQYLDQIPEAVRSAALGTVGSLVVFRVGGPDAEIFGRQFSDIEAEHFTRSWNYQAWTRLVQNGRMSSTQQLHTPPDPKPHGQAHKIINLARNNYAKKRGAVEDRIDRFLSAPIKTHSPARRRFR